MRNPNIIGIYLAAGKSSRMETNKLSLPLGDTTLGSLALQTALQSCLEHIVVVTKEEDLLGWMNPIFFSHTMRGCWSQVSCIDAGKGQSHSLRCGLREGQRRSAEGVMILLADQPFISIEIINDLIFQYDRLSQENQRNHFAAARFQGIVRPPVLFSHELFPVLLELQGDEGARKLLRRHLPAGMIVDYDDERAFFDIDTNEEYERAKEEKFK